MDLCIRWFIAGVMLFIQRCAPVCFYKPVITKSLSCSTTGPIRDVNEAWLWLGPSCIAGLGASFTLLPRFTPWIFLKPF